MKYINYMNIRVAHEIKDVSKPVLSFLYENGDFLNTLIVSPPGCGKTTFLRKVYEKAVQKGMTVEVYHYPLIKEKLETIIIKD